MSFAESQYLPPGSYRSGFVCRICRSEAEFSIGLVPGTTQITGTATCKKGHTWQETWEVGQPAPAAPVHVGIVPGG